MVILSYLTAAEEGKVPRILFTSGISRQEIGWMECFPTREFCICVQRLRFSYPLLC